MPILTIFAALLPPCSVNTMFKNALFSFIFLAIPFLSSGQSTTTVLKEQSLIKEQTIYLNSKARVGGKNRIVVPVRLPANTVAWYYSFNTVNTTNANQHVPSSGLQMQIAKLITDGALNLISAGLVTNIVSQLIKPTGSGAVDVYLTDKAGRIQFEKTDLVGMYSVNVPTFYSEGTAQNSRNGVFQVPVIRNDLSLCLRNPSVTEGVAISLDVVAIVSKKEYRDIWTDNSSISIYQSCLANFGVKDQEAEKICNCAAAHIKTAYKPSYFTTREPSEKNEIVQESIKRCTDQGLELDAAAHAKRVSQIQELIKGQEITKDHEAAARSYNELILLGERSWQVYNGLAYHSLCLKQFELARKSITTGLGKSPEQPDLLANLANFYLLSGKLPQALELYKENKNKKMADRERFKNHIAAQLREFERLGLANAGFAKTREELNIN